MKTNLANTDFIGMDTEDGDFIPVPVPSLATEVKLPFPVYIKVGNRYIIFRSRWDKISQNRGKTLVKKGVDVLFLLKGDWEVYTGFQRGLLENSKEERTEEEDAHLVRDNLLLSLRDIELKKEVTKRNLKQVESMSDGLANIVNHNSKVAQELIQRYGDPGMYYINHSVNVSIYAALIAQKLSFTKDQIDEITLAALLHNIGNIFVNPEILHSPKPLNELEQKEMQSHTVKGSELLSSFNLPEPLVLTARQHHERMDGKGYPDGKSGEEIHPYARICAIADVYDALLSKRPQNPQALAPHTVLKMMQEMEGKFDPKFFKLLIK